MCAFEKEKYYAVAQYLTKKNIDNKYLTEEENFAYIYYLASTKHLIDFGMDLHRRLLGLLMEHRPEYYRLQFKKYLGLYKEIHHVKDWSDYLSVSDEQCLDWAIDSVDMFTYNFDWGIMKYRELPLNGKNWTIEDKIYVILLDIEYYSKKLWENILEPFLIGLKWILVALLVLAVGSGLGYLVYTYPIARYIVGVPIAIHLIWAIGLLIRNKD